MEYVKKNELIGFFVIGGISILLTLVYLYTDYNNLFLDWFIPINSSLFEFSKLMFTSILIYGIIEYFVFGKRYDNFFFAKAASLFIGPILFVGSSYIIDLLIGNVYMITHIIMFGIALALGQYFSFILMQHEYHFRLMNVYAVFGIIVMLTIFLANLYQTSSFSSPIYKPMKIYENKIYNNR